MGWREDREREKEEACQEFNAVYYASNKECICVHFRECVGVEGIHYSTASNSPTTHTVQTKIYTQKYVS